MTMDLFILRHGEAGKRGTSRGHDSKRPLTAAGEKEITEIAESFKKIGIDFDVILTSPLKRAQQTGDIVARQFKAQKKMRQLQELSPEGSKSDLYRMLSSFKEGSSLLVVGHNPYLSEMISEVVMDGKYGRIDIKKGGVARIRITHLTPRFKGELRWLITPRLLKLISRV
jgi:phosphohistidine phosphatase